MTEKNKITEWKPDYLKDIVLPELTNWSDVADDGGLPEQGATKSKTFYQDGVPTVNFKEGDLWYDTNDGNKPYRANNSFQWVSIQDGSIVTAQTTADSKIVTFYATTAPTAEEVGDLWYDTDDSNKPYRWSGIAWISINNPTEWANVGDAGGTKPEDNAEVNHQLPSDENLVLYLPLDENSGSVAYDMSKNSYNGTKINSPTIIQGKSGKALQFLNTSEKQINNITNPFGADIAKATFCCWFNFSTYTGIDGAIFWRLFGNTNLPRFRFSNGSNLFDLEFNIDGVGKNIYIPNIATAYPINIWHFLVITFDNTVGVKVYIDDMATAIGTDNTTGIDFDGGTNAIVFANDNYGSYASVSLDEIRIYKNYVLTSSERKALYLIPGGNKDALGLAAEAGATDGATFGVNIDGGGSANTQITNNGYATLNRESYFGTGSDGDVTISGDTTLTSDMNYNNLTINTGKILNPNGWRILVKGTLTCSGTGKIANNGGNGGDGGNTIGVGGSAGSATSSGSLPAGEDGKAGGNSVGNTQDGQAGGNGDSSAKALSGGGSAGGRGGKNNGGGYEYGIGGTAGSATGTIYNYPKNYVSSFFLLDNQPTVSNLTLNAGSGAGGSGANNSNIGGNTSGGGGGSGAGGGIVEIYAKTIANGLNIEANGGNGGNGGNYNGADTFGGGGGGGGRGGVIIVFYETIGTYSFSVAGGSYGTAGTSDPTNPNPAVAGTAGGSGVSYLISV